MALMQWEDRLRIVTDATDQYGFFSFRSVLIRFIRLIRGPLTPKLNTIGNDDRGIAGRHLRGHLVIDLFLRNEKERGQPFHTCAVAYFDTTWKVSEEKASTQHKGSKEQRDKGLILLIFFAPLFL